MNKSLGEIDINPRIAAAAKRAGLTTAGSVITLSGPELSHLTGLNSGDAKQLADAVAEVVIFAPPTTALEILRGGSTSDYFMFKLSTGCHTLDQHLRGGVLTRGITEIVGESAAGKTQFCLQLCLTVQLPLKEGGRGSGAVYVCTEDTFPSKRFQQLVSSFNYSKYAQLHNICFTDHVYIEHISDLDGLNLFVQKKLPLLLARRGVQLVVIDSVAALFRCHYESHNLVARAKHLASLATQLRKLAVQYNVAIVCVNQVTANMSNTSDRDGNVRHSIPALGMAWADHVTCRFQMSRPQESLVKVSIKNEDITQERKNAETSKSMKTVRQLEVVFAPHLPHVVIPLVITASGVSCLK